MKVGLDIDNTITDQPEMFRILSGALRREGHEVHILTFRSETLRDETERELALMGVEYDSMRMGDGTEDPGLKAQWAGELKLNVMFEDNPSVLNAMPRGVQRIWMPREWESLGLKFPEA
jgi:hypothetical protein